MSVERAQISENGRIVIPADYRKAMGLKGGDVLTIRLDDEGLHLQSRQQAIRRAQAIVGKYVPAVINGETGGTAVMELLSEPNGRTLISTVNLSEAQAVPVHRGAPEDDAWQLLSEFDLKMSGSTPNRRDPPEL